MNYPRIGRGRARGGRIIDMSQYKLPSSSEEGKIMGGRGASVLSTNEIQPVAGRGLPVPLMNEIQPVAGRGLPVPLMNEIQPVAGRGLPVTLPNDIQPVAGRGRLVSLMNEIQPFAGRGGPVPLTNEIQPMAGRGISVLSTNGIQPQSGRRFPIEGSRFTVTLGRGTSSAQRLAAGRGIAAPAPEPRSQGNIVPHGPGIVVTIKPQHNKAHNNVDDAKIALEKDLIAFEKTGFGCFFRISLNYFSHDNDIEFYLDTVLNSVLKSSVMVEKFAMSLKLLTLLKTEGDEIKRSIFTKMQLMFQNTLKFMEERTNLNGAERTNLVNFCDLLGQMYFRLRPRLDAPDRYTVLAPPTIYCMTFLLRVCGAQELQVLAKLIILNFNALHNQFESKFEHLCLEAHKALLEESMSEKERLWLMFIIYLLTMRSSDMPQHLELFYAERLGGDWFKVAVSSPVQMIADLPNDITLSEVDKFNVSSEEYNMHKCAEL